MGLTRCAWWLLAIVMYRCKSEGDNAKKKIGIWNLRLSYFQYLSVVLSNAFINNTNKGIREIREKLFMAVFTEFLRLFHSTYTAFSLFTITRFLLEKYRYFREFSLSSCGHLNRPRNLIKLICKDFKAFPDFNRILDIPCNTDTRYLYQNPYRLPYLHISIAETWIPTLKIWVCPSLTRTMLD